MIESIIFIDFCVETKVCNFPLKKGIYKTVMIFSRQQEIPFFIIHAKEGCNLTVTFRSRDISRSLFAATFSLTCRP